MLKLHELVVQGCRNILREIDIQRLFTDYARFYTTGNTWRAVCASKPRDNLSRQPRLLNPLILIEASSPAYPFGYARDNNKPLRKETSMRFYTQEHRHYCGIDLHARSMYICILSQRGEPVLHKNMIAAPEPFLKAIEPFRDDIVVAVECIFTWYWLADLCAKEGIPFILGHALYMKAIHGGKAKNDKIDSRKIAGLLRSGMIPQAYVYPAKMRATRDLCRRRCHFVQKRAELIGHIRNTISQYNLPVTELKFERLDGFDEILDLFSDPDDGKTSRLI